MKLSNPACRKARRCQPFCGMCNLQDEPRLITDESLFGACRAVGRCICRNWSDTQNCYWINGKRVKNKKLQSGTYDCTIYNHPQHHIVQVSERELDENRQADYNQATKNVKNEYRESIGLYGGFTSWQKGKSKTWIFNNQVREYGG